MTYYLAIGANDTLGPNLHEGEGWLVGLVGRRRREFDAGGLVAGAITGIALVWIAGRPKAA